MSRCRRGFLEFDPIRTSPGALERRDVSTCFPAHLLWLLTLHFTPQGIKDSAKKYAMMRVAGAFAKWTM